MTLSELHTLNVVELKIFYEWWITQNACAVAYFKILSLLFLLSVPALNIFYYYTQLNITTEV